MFMNEISVLKFCACTYTVSSKIHWEHLNGKRTVPSAFDASLSQPQVPTNWVLRGLMWPDDCPTVQLSGLLMSPNILFP